MHRSTSFFAAIVAAVLLIGGMGCAPPRHGMRRPAQEQPVCDSAVDVQVEPLDPRIDAAFDRLHAATKKMPQGLPAVEARKTPPPPTRVASPFVRREADDATAIR